MARKSMTSDDDAPAAGNADAPESSIATREQPAPAKAAAPITQPVIYMGPSMAFKGGLFQYGRIFNNGLPAPWQAKADAEPAFRRMLVPVEKTGQAMIDLKDPNSVLAQSHAAVVAAYVAARNRKG